LTNELDVVCEGREELGEEAWNKGQNVLGRYFEKAIDPAKRLELDFLFYVC
jgi:hypothetical protein